MTITFVIMLLLAVGAVAGNLLDIELYQSISFIFGSVFALMAARMFGAVPAMLVAAAGSAVTILAWGHPWAAVVLTLEAGFVALALRRTGNLVLAVGLYWLFFGALAILLSYTLLLGLPWESAAFIALKQTINGLLNAVLAGLALAALRMRAPRFKPLIPRVGIHTLIFYLVALTTILSATIMMIAESRSQYRFATDQVRTALQSVAAWTLHDLDRDEHDQSHSAFFEVGPGAVRFASGPDGVSIAQFAVSIIDGNGQARTIQGTARALDGSGTLEPAFGDVSYWQPDADIPEMIRSRESRYVYEMPVAGRDDISAIHVEYEVAPIVNWLEAKGRWDMVMLALATGVTLLVTYTAIRWLMAPLRRLAHLSSGMDGSVRSGARMQWLPETGVAEYDTLSTTLDTAARAISRGFEERAELTATLECRVRERTAQLDLLNQVVRQTRNAVVITDVAGRITWVNEAFTQLSGYDMDALTGQVPGTLLQRTVPAEVRREMQSGLASGAGFDVELINHSKAGRPYWVEIRCSPLHDERGVHTGFIAIQNDVTERHNLEERLRQSQKLEAVGQLTGGLAHDFNNLLSVILGCSELLAEKVEDRPDLKKLADMAMSAAERGSDLTRSLLAFSRRQPLEPQCADLEDLTQAFVPLLRRTLGETIHLVTLVPDPLWPVRVDVSQYESAVLNLAVNARDAMPDGGTLSIRMTNEEIARAEIADIEEAHPGAYVCVEVADTGHGMSAEICKRVFEPFFSTKRTQTNSGLGLSMVFGFLVQSGGFVRIWSQEGKGTKISLYFPRTIPDASDTDGDMVQGAADVAPGRGI